MQPDSNLILILLSVLGAIVAALLGWAESGEPFDTRKFAASVGRAIFAGMLAALVFEGIETVTIWSYVLALLYGAGVDVTGHRAAGTLRKLGED